jgi:bacterial leucyl aminopeptidase
MMVTEPAHVVYFDIGDTLGTVRFSPTLDHIERLDVFPDIPGVLVGLTAMGARLGIISNRGNIAEEEVNRALQDAGIYDNFDPDLIIYGPKNSVDIFLRAAEKAGHAGAPARCLFVGENVLERQFAQAAGFKVAAHPSLAAQVLST